MNENKRLLIFFISIVLVIAIILVIAFWPQADTTFACGVSADKDYSKLGSINYKQYECLAEQNDKFAVAISDGLSDDEKKTLNEAAEKINVGIYYLSDDINTLISIDHGYFYWFKRCVYTFDHRNCSILC